MTAMETYKLTVVEPEAMQLINDLAKKGSVKLQKLKERKRRSKADRRAFYLSAPVMSDEELSGYLENRQWMSQWRAK